MADLNEFQEKVVETATTLDDTPMALLYHGPDGPEMFLQNDHRDPDDFTPHLGLLAAYVVQLSRATDSEPEEVLSDAETKINDWAMKNVGVASEQRGGDPQEDVPDEDA